nr:pentatricopeptide repeat-containing protein [Quercus suber]
MLQNQCQPEVITSNTVINGFCKMGRIGEALKRDGGFGLCILRRQSNDLTLILSDSYPVLPFDSTGNDGKVLLFNPIWEFHGGF